MHRRGFLSAAATLVLLSSTTAALADRADDLVEWLAGQGYTRIELSRTLLGRARVLAWRDGARRELIINPRTGEILRDVWLDSDGGIRTFSERSGDGDTGEGSGPAGSEDSPDSNDSEDEVDHSEDSGEDSGEDSDEGGEGSGGNDS